MQKAFFLIVGPSGVGKTSLIKRLLADFPNKIYDTITCTTRSMRPGEQEGQPYYFLTDQRFMELTKESYFAEWAVVHGYKYGTPKEELEKAWKKGFLIIMDIDIQGAQTLMKNYDLVSIFIHPPHIDSLIKRLNQRDDGKAANLEKRMETAIKEIDLAHKCSYEIVNDNLEDAYAQLKKLVEESLNRL
ncbi:MAG: guanylate kinase [Bdellovibrionaceae bacterium]|nr:guanylate kinase [Pseudobdellovibrionaceae bacterium]